MAEIELPEHILRMNRYLQTTDASGLLIHTSENPSPYSDYDLYLIFRRQAERAKFMTAANIHAQNIADVMPARLVVNWTTTFGGASSMYQHNGEVVKVDINTETQRSIKRSSAIFGSQVVFDQSGKLEDFLGAKKDKALHDNFYSPTADIQIVLNQYFGFNWNALSKIWKGDYRLVAFEMIPNYLKMIAQLEHACNNRPNRTLFNTAETMRPETVLKLDDIKIEAERGALLATLEKLQSLFRDLGTELSEREEITYPEEADKVFTDGLKRLKAN